MTSDTGGTVLCDLTFISSDDFPLGAWTCQRCGSVVAVPWDRRECAVQQSGRSDVIQGEQT